MNSATIPPPGPSDANEPGWTTDVTVIDVFSRASAPPSGSPGAREPFKPTLVIAMDAVSRAVVGWAVLPAPAGSRPDT